MAARTTTAINLIKDDNVRHNVMGVVQNVRSREYSGGKMLLFEIQDDTGLISFIAWNDAHDVFEETVKPGKTLKINSVVAKNNTRYNRLEMKLFPDTRVEVCATMTVNRIYGTISAAKVQTESTVRIKCIATDIGETEKSQKGQSMRKVIFMDKTDQINGIFLGDSLVSTISFDDGAILAIEGNISSNTFGSTLFVNSFEEVEDADLKTFWSSAEKPAKRARKETTLSTILEVKDAEVGAKGDFTGIVRSCSVPVPMSNDRVKRTFTIVDKSMAACDVGLFTDKSATIVADIGAAVKFHGIVSSYNTRSLTTQAIEVIDDETLTSWWTDAMSGDVVVEEISKDPRDVKTDSEEAAIAVSN